MASPLQKAIAQQKLRSAAREARKIMPDLEALREFDALTRPRQGQAQAQEQAPGFNVARQASFGETGLDKRMGGNRPVGLTGRGDAAVGGATNVGVGAGPGTGRSSVMPWRSFGGMGKSGGGKRIGGRGEAPLADTAADYTAAHGGLARELPSNLDRYHAEQSYSRDPVTGQRVIPSQGELMQERSRTAKAGDWEGRGAFESAMAGDASELQRIREMRKRREEEDRVAAGADMDPEYVRRYRMRGHRELGRNSSMFDRGNWL